jgi:hypothetical protein
MRRTVFCLFILWLSACTPELINPSELTVMTAIPTVNPDDVASLCETAARGSRDWVASIEALEALYNQNATCEGASISSRLYQGYLAYGTQLEQQGRTQEAIVAYQQANAYDRLGTEANARLQRLQQATPLPLETCDSETVREALENIPTYTPLDGAFVRASGSELFLENERYTIYGLNYYPRDTPFERFLTQTPINVLSAELDIILEAKFNTLRIFVRYQDLFICPRDGTIPNNENLERLDNILQTIGEKGLRAIVVLNVDADLSMYPLYSNPPHIADQTRFLVDRYKNEPTILAWDVRDRGDVDYRTSLFDRVQVLTWLADTIILVRRYAPNQLVTAGWWEDAEATAPLVDFVSFQHYGEYEPLRQTIAILKDNTNKPIFLASIGYSTNALDETTQRNLTFQALEEVRNNQMAGWTVYMAFDYPTSVTCIEPNCPAEMQDVNRYGVWNTSYFPKLLLEAIERVIDS